MVTVLKRAAKPGRKPKAAPQEPPGKSPVDVGNNATPQVSPRGETVRDVPVGAAPMMKVPDQWPFPGPDVLDALVAAGPDRVAQLLLWKQRIQNPELAVTITPEDITGFAQCTQYLDIKPALLIWRRPGVEAKPGIPATANRRAVPPTPGMPPAPFVTVRLVVQGTHDGFKPIENNESDYDASQAANKVRQLRQDIPQLAGAVRAMIASGDYSTSVLNDFVDGAVALAKAQ